jgi:hypothetical protein
LGGLGREQTSGAGTWTSGCRPLCSIDSVGLKKRIPSGNERLNAADAVRHAAPLAVQLLNQHGLEFVQPGVAQGLVEARAAGRRPAEAGIYLLRKDSPALLRDVLVQFVQLHFAALVRSAHSGVNCDHHGL